MVLPKPTDIGLVRRVLFPNAGLCGTIDKELVRTPDGQGYRITVLGTGATNTTSGDIKLPPCTASQLAGGQQDIRLIASASTSLASI